MGNRTGMIDISGITTYNYDKLDRLKNKIIIFVQLILIAFLPINTTAGNSTIIIPEEDTIDYTYPFPPEDTTFLLLGVDPQNKRLPDGLDIIETYFVYDSEYFYFKIKTKGKINTSSIIPYYYGIEIKTEEKRIKFEKNYYSFYFCPGCAERFKTFHSAPEAGYITYGKNYIFGEQLLQGEKINPHEKSLTYEKDAVRTEPIEAYTKKNELYFKIGRHLFKGDPDKYSIKFFTMYYEEISLLTHIGPLGSFQYESYSRYFSRCADSTPTIFLIFSKS